MNLNDHILGNNYEHLLTSHLFNSFTLMGVNQASISPHNAHSSSISLPVLMSAVLGLHSK